ncbi:MAG: hypothetical protein ABIL25_01925 [candidate division WOR-3 bacterium]
MSLTTLMQMAEALADASKLVAAAQRPVKPRERQGQLALLACLEKRLETLRRQLLEAVLVEMLWRYLDYVEGTDEGYLVRQLIADIGARR